MTTEIKWADGNAIIADSTLRWADGDIYDYWYKAAGGGSMFMFPHTHMLM